MWHVRGKEPRSRSLACCQISCLLSAAPTITVHGSMELEEGNRREREGQSMKALANQPHENGSARLVAELPGRVIVALDHLTEEERAQVQAAVEAFARHELDGTRL